MVTGLFAKGVTSDISDWLAIRSGVWDVCLLSVVSVGEVKIVHSEVRQDLPKELKAVGNTEAAIRVIPNTY